MIKSSPYRTWPVKDNSPWLYYQEWNQAIFLHWEVPKDVLAPFIPKELELDSFDGKYWVSLVAFTMNKVKFRYLPSFSPISDFHEVNLRTYVVDQGKPGVYFLSIEGEKTLSNFIAQKISGLPYTKSNISRGEQIFSNTNLKSGQILNTKFIVEQPIIKKDSLDIWLTERYSLYLFDKGIKYRYEIDHEQWPIEQIKFEQLELNYKIGQFQLSATPQRVHYSPGVKVLAWAREKL